MDKPQIISHFEQPLNYTVFDSKWVPLSAKFVSLGTYSRGTGALQIYELTGGKANLVKNVEKPKGFRCGTFGATDLQERFLATGDFDGKLQIWDLESLDAPIYSVKAHSVAMNAIDGIGGLNIGNGAPEIVTASRDGSVKVWDPRQKETPVAKIEAEEGHERRDCWTVAFGNSYNNTERCVCAGYDNGDLKLFDLRTSSLRWERNLKNGVCCVEFDRKDIGMNKLVATTLESKFHVFDLSTQHPKKGFPSVVKYSHNKSTVWTVRHLPQNRDVFMTTGGNGSLCLWNYEYPEKRYNDCEDEGSKEGVIGSVNMLQSHVISSQPVAGFEWNKDKLGLAVCSSFDQTIRVVIVTRLSTV